METRVLIGRRDGTIMAELEPELGLISWRLNRVGKATFTMAMSDAKMVESNLQIGNRVLIQFGDGLPDWGGVLDLPRSWDGSTVTCTCYSGEYLLDLRITEREQAFISIPPGRIFRRLVHEANAIWPMGVTVASAWTGGDDRSLTCHFANILARVQDLAKRARHDFYVLPVVVAGRIQFEAYWVERRGLDRHESVVLIEEVNCSHPKLTEQGPVINRWDVVGKGASWGTDRLVASAQDDDSIVLYGYRNASKVFPDELEEDTLEQDAEALLAESAYPRKIISLEVMDVAPALFADYHIGDIIRVIAPSLHFAGYDESVRVYTREYDPATDVCRLVIEEESA